MAAETQAQKEAREAQKKAQQAQASAPAQEQAQAPAQVRPEAANRALAALDALEAKPKASLVSLDAVKLDLAKKANTSFGVIFTGKIFINDTIGNTGATVPAARVFAKGEDGSLKCFYSADNNMVRKIDELIESGEVEPGKSSKLLLVTVPTEMSGETGRKFWKLEFSQDGLI